jgi:dolichol-phosphate mannosyltransferase
LEGNVAQAETRVPGDDAGVLVVFCTFNEVESLPAAIERLFRASEPYDVLVVDDNSPDGTGQWVRDQARRSERIHLISRPSKLGLGSALHDAFAWALQRQYQFVVNLDADLSHDPSVVPKLLDLCRTQPADLVIGSRYVPGGKTVGLSPARILASRLINAYARWQLKLPVKDSSGSFRCYRSSLLRKLDLSQLTCTGYGFLQEILVQLYRQGARVLETPILYHQRKGGRSKMRLADATGAVRVIHRLRNRK